MYCFVCWCWPPLGSRYVSPLSHDHSELLAVLSSFPTPQAGLTARQLDYGKMFQSINDIQWGLFINTLLVCYGDGDGMDILSFISDCLFLVELHWLGSARRYRVRSPSPASHLQSPSPSPSPSPFFHSGEVHRPQRNYPLGILLAVSLTMLNYLIPVWVAVGLSDGDWSQWVRRLSPSPSPSPSPSVSLAHR